MRWAGELAFSNGISVCLSTGPAGDFSVAMAPIVQTRGESLKTAHSNTAAKRLVATNLCVAPLGAILGLQGRMSVRQFKHAKG